MADNNNINSNNQFITDYIETMSLDQQGLLQSIDLTLKSIARSDGIKISQSSLKDLMAAEQKNDVVLERRRKQRQGAAGNQGSSKSSEYEYQRRKSSSDELFTFDKRRGKVKAGQAFDEVIEKFEETLLEGLVGSKNPFDDVARNIRDNLLKSFNAKDVTELGPAMGQALLKKLDKIPYTQFLGKDKKTADQGHTLGKQIQMEMNWFKDKANTVLNTGMSTIVSSIGGEWEDMDLFSTLFGDGETEEEKGPSVEDIEKVRDTIDNDVDNLVHSATDLGQIIREAAEYIHQGMEENTDRIIEAIWQTSGKQSDLGNEFDNGTPEPDVVAESPYVEVSPRPEEEKETFIDKAMEAVEGNGAQAAEGESKETGLQVPDVVGDVIGDVIPGMDVVGDLAKGAKAAGGALEGLGMAAPELAIAFLAASAAIEVISSQVKEVIAPAVEGTKSFLDGLFSAFNRDITAAVKYNQLARERAEKDIKTIREAAYDVIKDSANRIMQVWDSIETTIAATQQETKAGVQDLWSEYASRLKEEGLSKYVSSADIMEKLESVLEQGLQGAVAEEFAYQATLLNSAIPTEDFFQYAATYASIAANAIKAGKSQQEAIDIATDELRYFADNLLYASREVAEGFTTTLTNSSELFEKAATIALSAHETSTTSISRVLTTVSGAVGSIAPDLASGVIDAIYKAAVGGNSSEITALRSMAGVGASNTAFLQALTSNPQQILSTLFSNLAQLQSMSSSNYMEVAEGLSSVFGMSMEAFTRVDFDYLANAIKNMSLVVGDELNENLTLLTEGQTTSNDSQMRMQQINEYMIEEGLAYVLDNQVARSIQEHMWDEQLARELMEAQYSVDLVGGAKDMMTGILTTLIGLGDLINPVGWVKKVGNVVLTALEDVGQSADLKEILERGKVGSGNSLEFKQLTTYNKDLQLETPIVELLGGTSETTTLQKLLELNNELVHPLLNWANGGYSPADVVRTAVDLSKQGISGVLDATRNIVKKTDSAISKITQGIKNAVDKVVNGGEQTAQAASAASETASEAVASMSQIAAQATNTIVQSRVKAASSNKVITDSSITAVEASTDALTAQSNAAESTIQSVTNMISNAVDSLQNITKEGIDTTKAVLKKAAQELESGYQDAKNLVNSSAKEAYQVSKKVITEAAQTAVDAVKSVDGVVKNATNYFNKSIVGKSIQSLISSGDWRNNRGFNAYYQNYGESGTEYYEELPTQTDASALSDMLNTSIKEYIEKQQEVSSSLDNIRYQLVTSATNATENIQHELIKDTDILTEDMLAKLEEEGYVEHRGYSTNERILEEVLSKSAEIQAAEEATSFDAWLEKFQNETGIGNLSALLSEYGTDISEIESMYLAEQASRQNALTKARDLHEVQFWEDMQHFATVDFPSYLREWERYYIQHEAYTKASNEAYAEAVSLSVKEKGEMGDSVLALAEALTENNLWMQDLGNELKDPQLQANVILSKILLTVEAIMQQNNEVSIVSIPTALSSLGMGVSNV